MISLHSRRKLLPANERQLPSVAIYGQRLSRRSKGTSGPSKFSTPCSIRPAGRCTCRRSGPAMRKSPRSRCANKPPARLRQAQEARLVAEQLRVALVSRAEIDQAKGILMAIHGITAQQAFDRLVEHSQRRNVKLHDVAVAFIVQAGGEVSAE